MCLCICTICYHLQINTIINPKSLFENYVWETGISKSIKIFTKNLINSVKVYNNNKNAKILEIASNDGSVLSEFKNCGYKILGVEPAKNIAKIANDKKIPTLNEFFNYEIAKRIVQNNGKWDICIARNVIAHVKDLHGFIKGIKTILKERGVAIVEFPHLLNMYNELQYDQVFHEHIGYHSLHSMIYLLGIYEMEVFDVQELKTHGGSLRVYIQHANKKRSTNYSVIQMLSREINSGIFSLNNWKTYADSVFFIKKN